MKERIYKALVARYSSRTEEALLKIDMLMQNSASHAIMVDHTDITGEIDKLLGIVAECDGKLSKLRRFYGTN